MNAKQLRTQLYRVPDEAVVFVQGSHGTGIEEAIFCKPLHYELTGRDTDGELVRIHEECSSVDGTPVKIIDRRP
jgi:hypothetical protein